MGALPMFLYHGTRDRRVRVATFVLGFGARNDAADVLDHQAGTSVRGRSTGTETGSVAAQ